MTANIFRQSADSQDEDIKAWGKKPREARSVALPAWMDWPAVMGKIGDEFLEEPKSR